MTEFRTSAYMAIVVAALMTTGLAWGQTPGGAGSTRGTGGSARGGDTPHLAGPKADLDTNVPMTLLSAVQYRLELLEEDLRLRPEQRGAWLGYRERVLKLAEDAQRTARTALGGEMPAPKRLDRLADIARDRLTAIEDIVDAGKNLYATLTPGQQSVADRRMAVPVMALAGVEPNSAAARAGAASKNP